MSDVSSSSTSCPFAARQVLFGVELAVLRKQRRHAEGSPTPGAIVVKRTDTEYLRVAIGYKASLVAGRIRIRTGFDATEGGRWAREDIAAIQSADEGVDVGSWILDRRQGCVRCTSKMRQKDAQCEVSQAHVEAELAAAR